ncbi:MAG TPA: hypothetical protein VGS02_00375 [Acidobacteriaceae bacterium]|nr:hypothetical protein [Acidobacteriaceae bacterium]
MIDPVTTVNDQFKVATAADDWKGITSVTTLNDQFAVGKSSSGGRRLITPVVYVPWHGDVKEQRRGLSPEKPKSPVRRTELSSFLE